MRKLFSASLCLWAFLALAGPAEDGYTAYASGDYATALRLWRPLADQGHAEAQFILGVMYAEGQGVPQDGIEAAKWYRLAADQGDAEAQFILGVMYAKGQGVPQNYSEALEWSRRAADQGHAEAQFNLGTMYAKGQGAPQDYIEAHKWINLSSALATEKGTRERATQARDFVASKMTLDQVAEAQKLAREWKPTPSMK